MTTLERLSDFALSLRRESNIEGSSVCSPLSIGLVLALLHAGANGATKTQIAQALAKGANDENVQKMLSMAMRLSSSAGTKPVAGIPFSSATTSPRVEVLVANRLYLHANLAIEPNYLAAIKKNYDALAEIVDFSDTKKAAATINGFVSTVTKGKISNIVAADTIVKDTAAIVVNAIYFNAKWRRPFESEKTGIANFHPDTLTKREVQMMHQKAVFPYTETSEVQVLSMKYVDESYAYDVFLPKENFAGGLDAFLAGLTGTKMQTLLQKMESTYLEVFIPKSKVETNLNLNATLINLGIKDFFNPKAADLSGISKKPLYVNHVVHKAIIEVDEEGTTAAAASDDELIASCPPPQTIFNANRPYFFSLSKDGAPLFMGVYR